MIADPALLLARLLAMGPDAPSLEEKITLVQAAHRDATDGGRQLDQLLLERILVLTLGLTEAKEKQEKLKAILGKLSATPWHPAIFLRTVTTSVGMRAMVVYGGARRVVEVAEGIDLGSLAKGDEVFLGHDLNIVMAKSPDGVAQCGDTGFFERRIAGGRIVLRWRDEEVVVDQAAALADVELTSGDQLRFDRTVGMAFEKIEKAAARRFLFDDVPDVRLDQVGGQDENLATVVDGLTLAQMDPVKAARYDLGNRQTILLVGPNGTGKTLIMKAAAAEMTRLSGERCRIAVVKPAEWESPWVGETQANIRACFAALREAAKEGFAVLFLDEVEAVGRIRGSAVGHHSDKFLNALLAELDGFTDRAGVAIVAATNRKDLVDPALLERLSDIEVQVRRPDRKGARSIFRIHLLESLPYAASGSGTGDTRDEIIETAAARIYSPNAENELCVLRFRDGKTRTIVARELASGRTFEQICRAARRAACLRDIRGGEPGVSVADIEEAMSHAMERLASTLSPGNARAHLSDLPQDVDVVSVEPIVRRVPRPHRYLNAVA